uniref:Uncharacterized protein n=2 Tax=Acrobeloides nanus TaxID=290746 RepID=A0A914BX87_9BILA
MSSFSNQLADITYEGNDYGLDGVHGFNIEDNFGGPFKIFLLNRFANQAIFYILKQYTTLSIYTNVGTFETNPNLYATPHKITTEYGVIEYLLRNGILGIKELRIWNSAISVLQEIQNLALITIHWTFVTGKLDDKIAEEFRRILLANKTTLKNLHIEESLLIETPFDQLNLNSLVILSYNGSFIDKFLLNLKTNRLELNEAINIINADMDLSLIIPNYSVKILDIKLSRSLSEEARETLKLYQLLMTVSKAFPNLESFNLILVQDSLFERKSNRLATIREFATFLTNLEFEMLSFNARPFNITLDISCFCQMNWTTMYIDNNELDAHSERAPQNFVHKNIFPDFYEEETTAADKQQYVWMRLAKHYGELPKKTILVRLC